MFKKCLVEGCPRDAERWSSYCTDHHRLDSSLSGVRVADDRVAFGGPGMVPVDDRYSDDGIKLPGTIPVDHFEPDPGPGGGKLPFTVPVKDFFDDTE